MIEILRHRGFRNLWLGQAISQLGDAFYYVVFMFMVKKLTGDALMVGLVGAVETLPFLFFSAYGGVLADRIDRRKIMLYSDVVSGMVLLAFCAMVFVYGNAIPLWTVFATAFLTSAVRSLFLPAKNAAIPNLIPEDKLIQANSLSYMTQSWMPMIGLALSAGVLSQLYAVSEKWFFVIAIFVNASSFFFSAFYIAKLPSIVAKREEAVQPHPWTDLKEGVRYIGRHGALKALMILSVFMSLTISPFFVVYIEANDRRFGGLPQNLALCEFTFFVGLIIGGYLVAKTNIRRPGLGYIWGLSVTGISVALMAWSYNFNVFCALNIVAGIAVPFADIPIASYLQLTVEDSFRGRVNSALTMMRMGITPLGLGLAGLMVKGLGLIGAFLLMGIGMLVVALAGLMSAPFRLSVMPETAKVEPDEIPAIPTEVAVRSS